MADDIFREVKNHFHRIPDTEVNEGRGAQGVKYGDKMFCMFMKGGLVLKFPQSRVQQIIADHGGKELSYAKNRVLIPSKYKDQWLEFATESYEYAKSD